MWNRRIENRGLGSSSLVSSQVSAVRRRPLGLASGEEHPSPTTGTWPQREVEPASRYGRRASWAAFDVGARVRDPARRAVGEREGLHHRRRAPAVEARLVVQRGRTIPTHRLAQEPVPAGRARLILQRSAVGEHGVHALVRAGRAAPAIQAIERARDPKLDRVAEGPIAAAAAGRHRPETPELDRGRGWAGVGKALEDRLEQPWRVALPVGEAVLPGRARAAGPAAAVGPAGAAGAVGDAGDALAVGIAILIDRAVPARPAATVGPAGTARAVGRAGNALP